MKASRTNGWRDESALEPDTVLPSQFFSLPGGGASLQPEKHLMVAVLAEAVGTVQKNVTARDGRAQRLFMEAIEWFESDHTDWPFSFVNLCHALGLEPGHLRSGLRRWCDRQRAAGDRAKVVRLPFSRVHGGPQHRVTGRAAGVGGYA
jgi:hypothetical protein